MTREEKLYTMTGTTLIGIADELGVKISCNKTRTGLKESKASVIEKILAAEAKTTEKPVEEPEKPTEATEEPIEETKTEAPKKKAKKESKKIEPFVYTDEDGIEWEDDEIGEKIAGWPQEKKDAFTEYFNDKIKDSDRTIEDLVEELPSWSDTYDKEHGIETPKAKAPKVKENIKRPSLKLKEITYNGETKSIKEWAEELKMPWATLYDRINRNGWTPEEAIEIPLGGRRAK